LTATALGVNYYKQVSTGIKQQAVKNMERLSEQSAFTLELYMSNIKNFVWNYFGDVNFQQFVMNMGSDPREYSYYQSRFSQFSVDNPMVDLIMVTQLEGNRILAGSAVETELFRAEQSRLWDIAIHNDGKGQWVISKVYDSESDNNVNTLVFVQALKEVKLTSRPIIGVMMIQLKVDSVQSWLRGIITLDQGGFYVIDGTDGTVLLANDTEYLEKNIITEENLKTITESNDERHFFTSANNKSSLIVFQELTGTNWILVGKVAVHILLKQVNEAAKRTFWIGAIALFVSMGLASLLSSMVITPLKKLLNGVKSIGIGNYNVSVPVETEDEIGYLCIAFNKMSREINHLIVKVYKAELVKKEAEIKSLQSQINPHFLYNTLGTIESLASIYLDDRISFISRSMASMFRYNINARSVSTFQDEISQIELYLSIQKIRFGDRLRYSVYIEAGLEQIRMPKLLLQPLVENSILHGIDQVIEGGTVKIKVYSVDDKDMEIVVWNNGPAMDPEKVQQLRGMLESCSSGTAKQSTMSIGLVNVQSRIKLIYGPEYGLFINSGIEQETEVRIRVSKLLREEETYREIDHSRG
jgi:two-component system sensor histidine kinase YesM